MMFHEIEPYRLDIAYGPGNPRPGDVLILSIGNEIQGKIGADGELTVPVIDKREPAELQYLFSIRDTSGKGRDIGFYTSFAEEAGEERVSLWQLRQASPKHLAFACALACRLLFWYRDHRFCSRCGGSLVHSETERAMVCPACGNTVYPSIPPSVIVALRSGEELLVTRYQVSHNRYRGLALVAGYVESGETPEETVVREVAEEVGLKVKNITYYGSQPWPLSGSLLLGYVCDLDGEGDIHRDDGELEEAMWMRREDLPDRSGDVSLTSRMMEAFRLGEI